MTTRRTRIVVVSDCTYMPPKDSTFVITPVSKKAKSTGPCSKTDWAEQNIRMLSGNQMMWDDSPRNSSVAGGVLLVWHHKKFVTCHKITETHTTDRRLESWSKNVGQGNRNVLYIDPPFATITWDVWVKRMTRGDSVVHGTFNVKADKQNTLDLLAEMNEE